MKRARPHSRTEKTVCECRKPKKRMTSCVPKEVLWFVFSYAGPSSFGIFRAVCKQWKRIVDSPEFRTFYNRVAEHFFSEYTFGMFANGPNTSGNLPAKFVSIDSFCEGYVTSVNRSEPDGYDGMRYEMMNMMTVETFRMEEDKLIRPCSINGNTNNWTMSKKPNSLAALENRTKEIDNFFQPPLPHPTPPPVANFDEMLRQRNAFYAELTAKRKYGIGGLVYDGG